MPLIAAAVCPHPPLLVPELAGAAAGELDDLRAVCDAAVGRLYACGARSIVVVGDGPRTATYRYPFRGSLAPWGVPVEIAIGRARPGHEPPALPLSLTIGAWLWRRVALDLPVARMHTLAADATPGECADFGAGYQSEQDWALLVMGDGSACRGVKAPGYDDPRAPAYDDGVARALAGADTEALLGLDPVLSAELKVAGRAPWQVLAGAVRAAGDTWHGDLSYHQAPYGVSYFVATWERA